MTGTTFSTDQVRGAGGGGGVTCAGRVLPTTEGEMGGAAARHARAAATPADGGARGAGGRSRGLGRGAKGVEGVPAGDRPRWLDRLAVRGGRPVA